MKILLINPAIYDFAAFDFWQRPYGLLTVGGFLRTQSELVLFDYLDRNTEGDAQSDQWGRGRFFQQRIKKPEALEDIPRYFSRYGRNRSEFQKFLRSNSPFDFALIQTVMTYWYPGVAEVIEDIKTFSPQTQTIAGGVYAAICPEHCKSIGIDFVLRGIDLNPLWDFIGIKGNKNLLPFWQGYPAAGNGVLKLADGCPFKCTYCSVSQVYPEFKPRGLARNVAELEFMAQLGIKNIAFYDDALLYKTGVVLEPFLKQTIKENIKVNFHTPNALNARFITPALAELMVEGGFKTFYIGFESGSRLWQSKTGGKVYCDEFAAAVEMLVKAGAERSEITAYIIFGHPQGDFQEVEESMRFAHDCGVRVMLADFSPIPGTPDGELCSRWVDLKEPLNHNKTSFPIRLIGFEQSNSIKQLCRDLNGDKTKISSH